jgi:F0F1-type ATP synthase membrane subunit c/vacuolar-type H+-ATPase subunit K
VQGFMWIGFALVEAVALYALLIALLLLFVF